MAGRQLLLFAIMEGASFYLHFQRAPVQIVYKNISVSKISNFI